MMKTPLVEDMDRKLRKILGRTYLHENRLADALNIWTALLRDHPQDVDALLTVGNLYLVSGNPKTATRLFRQALVQSPENLLIERQMALAQLEQDLCAEETDPIAPEAINRLMTRVLNEDSNIGEDEISRAADILEDVRGSADPAIQVAARLDEIDQLLPALLELNIRQARAGGQPELAQALQSMQINWQTNIQPHVSSIHSHSSLHDTVPTRVVSRTAELSKRQPASKKILLLNSPDRTLSPRLAFLKEILISAGYQVQTGSGDSLADGQQPDLIVVSNPHVNPHTLEDMALASARGVPVLLDMDRDFENLPVSHPDYTEWGLDTPLRTRAYTAALLMASAISVPSRALTVSLSSAGYRTFHLPDGWSQANRLWQSPHTARPGIQLGWSGTVGQLEDLAMIRRIILRVLREFASTRLVIYGNPEAYQLFDSLAEERRIYLPPLEQNAFPGVLNQMDLLMVPLLNTPFNQSTTDLILVQAGVKRIPWVASPTQSFTDWGSGGWVAKSLEEWHSNLRQLVTDADLRINLGREGQRRAQAREMHALGAVWLRVVQGTIDYAQKQQLHAQEIV